MDNIKTWTCTAALMETKALKQDIRKKEGNDHSLSVLGISIAHFENQ